MTALGDYGYAFDELELRLFVKSFIVKARRSVAQFKDNLPGVDWVKGFMKRHKDLLAKRIKVVDHADSQDASHLVRPLVLKHIQKLRVKANTNRNVSDEVCDTLVYGE